MASSYHEMTDENLKEQLDQAKAELRELRFTFGIARSLQKPARVGQLKKNVARINTVLRERELGLATQKEATSKGKGKSRKK
ncbi:MAG TPA: 50S ribosomal protein L29 [Leptospiraceae bacterium]|nr:50S ribosomal protein L29 [Spirochaetaceae bacterium]HBS05405.1 50S ribosomal protein L29 [Leptospiraceae bacterium]|tara:strand:+ start:143 stop:388 length:246 start_codon:yes stop_codon:yes gene_type:complete